MYKHIHKRISDKIRISYNKKSVGLVSSFKDEKAMQKKMRTFFYKNLILFKTLD